MHVAQLNRIWKGKSPIKHCANGDCMEICLERYNRQSQYVTL